MFCLFVILVLHHFPVLLGMDFCSISSGNKHLIFLEFNNSAGEGRLWFKGVAMYERMGKCGSSPLSMVLVRLFLIVCTKCSACPLDCALVDDVTLLYSPHFHEFLGTPGM